MPAEAASTPSSAGIADFTRLHITPLDPELLKIILPSSVAAQARNISFHTIETFPERRYGFVDLPQMEADKLKRKLNGTVLKGHKVRVEKARPEERIEPTGDVEQKEKKRKKSRDGDESSKKRKRDRDVVEGFALTDRKVKRGWTEPVEQRRKKRRKDKDKVKGKDKGEDEEKHEKTTEKKKRLKSKYTEQEECLLKTKVPPNAVGNIPPGNLSRKKKNKGQSREVTVHEFEKTTKFPSFLRDASPETKAKRATEFVEGKGWVDEEGNVVESVKVKATPAPKLQKAKVKRVVEREPTPEDDDDDDDSTSSSGTSSSGSSSDEESEDEEETATEDAPSKVQEEPTSPAGILSPIQAIHATPLSAIKADSSRPMSSSSARSLTIKIPVTPSAAKVHPLEALYKRSNPDGDAKETPAQDAQPFSFFGGGGGDDEDMDDVPPTVQAPMTPFTREEFEWRTVRSAAPTPDTAHPSRMKNFWAPQEEDNLEEEDAAEVEAMIQEGHDEEGYDDDAAEAPGSQQAGSSEFQSWFWSNRRELNQSWMKRRKTAAKEKRHRENKARASKAV